MKKLLSLLLTLLMVFTLIGCNSKKEEPTPTIEEPVVEKQEEEVKQEEPTPEIKEEEPEVNEPVVEKEVKPVLSTDPTQYSYWVVTYDQFGNEVSRTTAKYGTTVKDPDGNDVVVKGNTYFHTTINYSSSKDDTPSPVPIPVPIDNICTITLNANGGTGGSGSTTVTIGASSVTAFTIPTREGYQLLDGWYTSASGGVRVLSPDGQTMYGAESITAPSDPVTWERTDPITLHAHWTANNYTVKFDANGGQGAMADQSFVYDTPDTLAYNSFTPPGGMTFFHWNTSPDNTGESYDGGMIVGNLTNVPDGEVTLYAIWQ